MRSACGRRSLAYSCMITGQPASAIHVGMPSAIPIISCELTAIAERSLSQPWATDMITLLCQANALVSEALAQDLKALPTGDVERLRTRYDTILIEAEAGNPPHPRRPGTRGHVKQSPTCNLIRRLREHRNEVLRFLTDRHVPFDNNRAERDLRMPKLKQKVSGCFRSERRRSFAIIRSYLSIHRKQSDDLFTSLVLTFQGQPPMPQLE